MCHPVQHYSSSHSQGFKDEDFWEFPRLGWCDASVATYCPSKPSQLTQTNITKHGKRVVE